MEILAVFYVVAGYWAAGVVLYENKILIYEAGALFFRKFVWGIMFGWIFIPIAVLKRIFMR